MKKFSLLVIVSLIAATVVAQQPLLTLTDAVKIAIQNNYDILIAKNLVEAATINNNWGNAGALPTIALTANKTLASNNLQQNLSNGTIIKRDGASVNNLNAGVAVNWRFFDGMRMYATKNRLAELEKIGEINFTRMVNETAYDVISSYLNIVRLKQQVKATQEVIALNNERLKIATAKFKIGTSAKTDQLQAEVDLNEQKALLLGFENNISIEKSNLNTFLARAASTPFETADSIQLQIPGIDYTAIQQKLSTQNPQVLLAKSNLAVLMQTKKEINAQRLPSANLGANYNFLRNKNAAGFTLLNQSYGPSATIGLSIPIFNGGNVKRQLKVADIDIKNQQLANQQIQQQLNNTLNNAFLNYNNGKSLATLEQQNLLLVKENNLINLERFRLQSITSVELRQGQLNYASAQTRLINSLFQAKIAEAEMLLLAGEITKE
ncbi:MAG: TolC family protein [Ferruginibacter sp.]